MVLPLPPSRPASRHSAKVCASLGTWRAKTLSLSGDLQTENSIASRARGRTSGLKVDVIVTTGPIVTRAAKEATSTIPIVMTNEGDPVGTGFVASLARPGGTSLDCQPLPGAKRKTAGASEGDCSQALPRGRLRDFDLPGNAQRLREVELAAKAFGVKLQYLDVLGPKDIETAFRAAVKGRADAMLWQVAGGVANAHRTQILELAVKSRLPAIYHNARMSTQVGL